MWTERVLILREQVYEAFTIQFNPYPANMENMVSF